MRARHDERITGGATRAEPAPSLACLHRAWLALRVRLADDPLVPEIARLLKSDSVKHDATAQARASAPLCHPRCPCVLALGSSARCLFVAGVDP